MKERPILFSAPMVQALLRGEKTQTRRIIKPEPHAGMRWDPIVVNGYAGWTDGHGSPRPCCYGEPGDRLWVREKFLLDPSCDAEAWDTAHACYESWADLRTPHLLPEELRTQDNVLYAASWTGRELKWQPSIHMPRWASRLTLEVTGVRVERVQTISEEDAQAEGAEREFRTVLMHPSGIPDYRISVSYRGGFANLWNRINEKRGFSWESNPWVWCVSFRRVSP